MSIEWVAHNARLYAGNMSRAKASELTQEGTPAVVAGAGIGMLAAVSVLMESENPEHDHEASCVKCAWILELAIQFVNQAGELMGEEVRELTVSGMNQVLAPIQDLLDIIEAGVPSQKEVDQVD